MTEEPRRRLVALLMAGAFPATALAWPPDDCNAGRHAVVAQDNLSAPEALRQAAPSLPANARLLRDVRYGADRRQAMDIYLPCDARNAPAILMVHGGGWSGGDKARRSVTANKAAHWVGRGYVFVSINYRLSPDADPLTQADDVALALAQAQSQARNWGADAQRFILMGHSAGAHLVALLSSDPERAFTLGARPWPGTVALDSAALDVPAIMTSRHVPLYDRAFGSDAGYWRRASPAHALSARSVPLLAVCSTQRRAACPQADNYAARAGALGVRAEVLKQDLSHRQINEELGLPGSYTEAVEAFMASLH